MRSILRGLLNPGKIVDGPSPTAHLRLGANYHRLPIATTFDFSRQGSLAEAAELCNGAGVCRKTQTGTMCPSFMATGEEEHSTRGRANALRLALSGALPQEELTGPRLFATYDLCLQLQRLQSRVPFERGRGEDEDGVSRSLLSAAWRAAGRSSDVAGRGGESLGIATGAPIQLAVANARRACRRGAIFWASIAGGPCRRLRGITFAAGSPIGRRARASGEQADRASRADRWCCSTIA